MPEDPHFERQVTQPNARILRGIVLFVAFVIRAVSLDFQGLWRDEVDQWRFALSPLKEMFSRFTESGWNGPLFSPLLRIWILGVGESVYAMRYLSLLCGVITVSLIYILSQRLFNTKVAFWSACLCALSPYLVWYAQEIKMYTWVPMLIVLALYGLERACVKPSWMWWSVTLIATCLAFYSHILAALVVPVLILWFMLSPYRNKKAWVGGAAVLTLLTLPYIPLLVWQLPIFMTARDTGYPAYTFTEMTTALITGWTTGIYSGSWTGGMASKSTMFLLSALAVLGMVGKNWVQTGKLLVWLLFPFTVLWFVSLRSPMFTDRYLIWSAPAFYLFIAVGITKLASIDRKWMWGLGFIVLLSLCPPLLSQSRYPIKPQFNRAVEFLMDQNTADGLILFQIPYNAHVFNYYARNQIFHQADAPYTNWKLADGSYQIGENYVQSEMVRIVRGYQSIWLVYSEVALGDQRELVKTWLDTRWQFVDKQVFVGVTLYHYVAQ